MLPGLTDDAEHLDAAIGAIAEAGATGVTVIPLHLRPGAREWFMAWLRGAHPELVPRYEQLYARRAYVPAEYRTWLAAAGGAVLARHGLDRQSGGTARQADDPIATGRARATRRSASRTGSLPTGGMPGVRPKGEMPTAPRPAAGAVRAAVAALTDASAGEAARSADRPGGPHDAARGHRGRAGGQRQPAVGVVGQLAVRQRPAPRPSRGGTARRWRAGTAPSGRRAW